MGKRSISVRHRKRAGREIERHLILTEIGAVEDSFVGRESVERLSVAVLEDGAHGVIEQCRQILNKLGRPLLMPDRRSSQARKTFGEIGTRQKGANLGRRQKWIGAIADDLQSIAVRGPLPESFERQEQVLEQQTLAAPDHRRVKDELEAIKHQGNARHAEVRRQAITPDGYDRHDVIARQGAQKAE